MRTKSLHGAFVHICLSDFENNIRVTLPALLGRDAVIAIIRQCVDAAENALDSSRYRGGSVQDFANRWPEYVLGPENPLTFLDPGWNAPSPQLDEKPFPHMVRKHHSVIRKSASFPFQISVACWIDLLGYGAIIAQADFNPLHSKAKAALARLRRAFTRSSQPTATATFQLS